MTLGCDKFNFMGLKSGKIVLRRAVLCYVHMEFLKTSEQTIEVSIATVVSRVKMYQQKFERYCFFFFHCVHCENRYLHDIYIYSFS